ncbi:MAG: sulfurtransferase [Woeseiaceae bacterium]
MAHYRCLIDVDDLRSQLEEPGWRVVDCRFNLMRPQEGLREYRGGHIPGAQYANLDKDLAAPIGESSGRHPLPSADTFAKTLGDWGIDNGSQVVVYDQASGAIAARLWWMLRWVGHERVALVDGGYAAWQAAGYPVSDKREAVRRAQFEPAPDSGMVISTEELEALIDSGRAPPLVDAREGARFAGTREPIDSVAGHIPGAVNYPFAESLNPDGSFKRRDELKAGWSRVLGDQQAWISMCGSGVTACHLAFSARLAGFPAPRLYAGSWSEWIRDPARAVAETR